MGRGSLEHVDQAMRADYLRAAIDSYTYRQDAALASRRYNALGKYKEATLAAIYLTADGQTQPAIAAFASAVEASEVLEERCPRPPFHQALSAASQAGRSGACTAWPFCWWRSASYL